jgi:hypothetical protein
LLVAALAGARKLPWPGEVPVHGGLLVDLVDLVDHEVAAPRPRAAA